MIDVSDLSLALDGVPILRGVSFRATAGESISLIGPNGAGKSTLLRCLLGLQTGCTGDIRLNGRTASDYTVHERARLVSYVPQLHEVDFPLSVGDFVMMGRYPHLKPLTPPSAADHTAVEQALETTGTACFRNRKLSTLSGGERQKVYIAAALAQSTPLILLEEPAAFLDYHHQADIMALLHRINAESGTTVLAVNHDLNSAVRWSGRLIALKAGEVSFDGPPEQLMNPEALEALYGIAFRLISDRGIPLAVTEHTTAE